jgi:hypothetical protein
MRGYKSEVPEGKCWPWAVERFTVSPDDEKFGRLRAAISFSSWGRFVPAGIYTRLTRNGAVIMSDTPDEIRDHSEAVYRAHGNILLNGLGLGVVLDLCLQKPEVGLATVVEKSPEVIDLVGKYFQDKYRRRLVIWNEDALTHKPHKGIRYDMVWHDIWDDLCADNLEDMKKLHRKYGRISDWQGSWGRDNIERRR